MSVGSLELFYKFYQVCETPNCIDLQQDSHLYTLPDNHPQAAHIKQALPDLARLNSGANSKLQLFDRNIFSIKACPEWLLRAKQSHYAFIQDAPMGPGSSSTLRVVMNHRLKKKIREQNLDAIVPDEYLVYSPDHYQKGNYEDFIVVAKKLDVLSYEQIRKEISLAHPDEVRKIATTIARIIYHTGFMDAHLANIVLTRDHKVAIVDTEGHALIHDSSENYSPVALSDARIVGLKEMLQRSRTDGLPETFTKVIEKYLLIARIMKIVKVVTIIFSILCPLIPIVVLITSLFNARCNTRTVADVPMRPSLVGF